MAKSDGYILRGPPAVPLPSHSLGEHISNKLRQHGNKIAQIDAVSGEKCTYNDILAKSRLLASNLQAHGVRPGDVIGIISENSLLYSVPLLASLYLGAICAPYNPSYTAREILHVLRLSHPKIIFCSSFAENELAEALKQHPARVDVIVMSEEKDIDSHMTISKFLVPGAHSRDFQLHQVQKPHEEVAFIMCSSGTTGLPKGVMLTHSNMISSGSVLEHPSIMMVEEETTVIGFLPFFHSFGISGLLQTLYKGITMIVMAYFAPDTFLQIIQDYKIKLCMMVPPLIALLAKHPLVDSYDLSSLERIGCGAAPLSRELHEELLKRFPKIDVRQGYGLTECTLGVLVVPKDKNKFGSSGTVVPGMEAKVIDITTGKPLGPGKDGEVCFRGCLIMKGYINDTAATEATIDSEGWLHSGDIGYYDEDGYFFIIDRLKELIKYKGFQVAPAELEALLMTHPAVQDAAVIGVPDDVAGELPKAFIVKQSEVTEEELVSFVSKQVSPTKRLRGGVQFVTEIPKNPSGKILRRELRQRIKSKL